MESPPAQCSSTRRLCNCSLTRPTPLPAPPRSLSSTPMVRARLRPARCSTSSPVPYRQRPASGNTVAATVGYDGSTNIATVTPASMLAVGTTYTASLATTIKADDGMALASPFSWSFTTEADAIPPTITAPADVAVTTSSGTCAASPGLGTATASDNSGTVTVTNNAPAIF
ncbi:MAG: hypothetical protein E6J49_04580, partial [Chloroflexi bacterium]